jgi:mono/diheme cytochrome c family protein
MWREGMKNAKHDVRSTKGRFFNRNSFLLLTSCFLLLSACGGPTTERPWEYMPNMAHTPSVRAFEEPMRMPPAGTVPIGYTPYPYAKDQGDLAGAQLTNPLPVTRDVLMRGQTVFNTYCIVCHGERGQGDGYIIPKFPRPPSLQSDKVRNWSDGRIFHVVTMGQNLMPSYASQIRQEDRWSVIRYLRVLQRAEKPSPEDVEELKKALKEGKVL